MRIAKILNLLEIAVCEPHRLAEIVPVVQSEVWRGELQEGPSAEILRDLAFDLDFYEPNPKARLEDPSFRSAAEIISEIQAVLKRLRELESARLSASLEGS